MMRCVPKVESGQADLRDWFWQDCHGCRIPLVAEYPGDKAPHTLHLWSWRVVSCTRPDLPPELVRSTVGVTVGSC